MSKTYIISESQLGNIVGSVVDKTGTDIELIDRLKDGDERARTKLYNKYFPIFTKMIYDKTNKFNEDEINEIISNALNRAMTKIHLYTYKGSFNGWLFKILNNSINDFIMKYKKEKSTIVPISNTLDIEDTNSEGEETGKHFMKLLQVFKPNISEKQFNYIQLYLSGLKHEEIAKIMGSSSGTSKWQVSDGLAKFKRWLVKNEYLS